MRAFHSLRAWLSVREATLAACIFGAAIIGMCGAFLALLAKMIPAL